jgi:hypothetical protein
VAGKPHALLGVISTSVCCAVAVAGSSPGNMVHAPAAKLASTGCTGSVYSMSAVGAQNCGYSTYPVLDVKPTDDGGSFTTYHGPGGTYISVATPPSNFDPGTATAADLSLYGFQARPSSTSASLADWLTAATHRNYAAAPAFMAAQPGLSNSASSCTISGNDDCQWAGYMVDKSGHTFTTTNAVYNEPIVGSSSCSTTVESTWAGLGGYGNWGPGNDLAQDGTMDFKPSNGSQDEAWFELVSSNSGWFSENAVFANVWATEGQEFDAITQYLGANVTINNQYYSGDTYEFYLENLYTGSATVVYQNTGMTGWENGTSAEFIAERPQWGGVNSWNQMVTNVQSFGFDSAVADGQYYSSWPWWEWIMVNYGNTGDTLVTPSSPGQDGFAVTQNHCW